jgi:hypothetical protein
MCHTNIDIDPRLHSYLFPGRNRLSGRLFTISQGQYRIDLPAGFGIPVLSTEPLMITTQALNLNPKQSAITIRHRVVVRYVLDCDLSSPFHPLFPTAAYALKLLDGHDGYLGLDSARAGHLAALARSRTLCPAALNRVIACSCAPGTPASDAIFSDKQDRQFTGHWVVPPGREETHTRVTDMLGLQFNATIHYVALHLHPFGVSISLYDMTTNTAVYEGKAMQVPDGIGLAHVDWFSSQMGMPIFCDHDYELVAIYNNTTDTSEDAMAVMTLYVLDSEFRKPQRTIPRGVPSFRRR